MKSNNAALRHATILIVFAAAALGAAHTHAELRPLLIERAVVLNEGETRIFGHGAWEVSREGMGGDFDNLRIGPLGIRHGIGNGFELGGSLTLSANNNDDPNAPDDTGLEGLTLFGKFSLNRHFALELGLTILGDDDVRPYPNDGIDFFVNVPMQRELGAGLLYGEFGYTAKDQDAGNNFFNFGVGYAYPMTDDLVLNIELVGDENPTFGRNHGALAGGIAFNPGENVRVAPFLTVGIFDASPDVSFGATFELDL